jgi:hypothetical protein
MANNYPDWAAGDPITASMLNYTQGDVIVKSVDTSRASTTTFADDPDLTTTLDASAVYFVEMWLHVVSPITEGIKLSWTVPTGATGNRSVIGIGSSQSVSNADGVTSRLGVHNFSTVVVYGDRNNDTFQTKVVETSVLTTTSSGTLALAWAQNASGSTPAVVSAGSCMRVKRVA